MKQKYSEHSKHATTQPSTSSFVTTATTSNPTTTSYISSTTASTSSSTEQQHQSNLENDKISNKQSNKDNKSKNINKIISFNKTTNKKTNQIASGITKSSSFSLLYNRNANKQNKSTVHKQQSENLPSSSYYFIKNVQQQQQFEPIINFQQQQQQQQSYLKTNNIQQYQNPIIYNNKKILHSSSMDSISNYQSKHSTCPKHSTYPFKQHNQQSIENIESNLKFDQKLKTFSLHSINENLNKDDSEQTFCSVHNPYNQIQANQEDKSSQTEESNLEENEYCCSNIQNPNNYLIINQQHHLPHLRNLQPAHSLPPSYLPPTTLLKSSSSFPTPQSSYFYCHHTDRSINENKISTKELNNFYTNNNLKFNPHSHQTDSDCIYRNIFNTSNQLKNQIRSALNQQNVEFQNIDQQQLNENYFCDEQPSTESTGIIMNAMAEMLDNDKNIADFSLDEFDDRMNLTTVTGGYSLDELEEVRDENNYRLSEDELLKDEELEEKEKQYLDTHQINYFENENCEFQMQENDKQKNESYVLISFKNKSNKEIDSQFQNKFCLSGHNSTALNEHKEHTLHEMNNNENLNYQLNSQVNNDHLQKEDEMVDLISDENAIDSNDNLTKEMSIKKSRANGNYFNYKKFSDEYNQLEKELNLNEQNRSKNLTENSMLIEKKKKLRDSTSSTTDSNSLTNGNSKKIKNQITNVDNLNNKRPISQVSKKRNWFLRQLSNSSKSSQTNTNCDTCSIITNQDTMDDNVFNEKLEEEYEEDNNKTNLDNRELENNTKLTNNSTSNLQAATTTFNLLNQTKNKLAQLRSQIKQQTSIESDQSLFTKTTISLTNSSSHNNLSTRQVSRQESQSSFGLKKLFRKKKRRLSKQQDNQFEQQHNSNKRLNTNSSNSNINNNKQNTNINRQQQQFKKDKHHQKNKLKTRGTHTRIVNTKIDKRKCIGGIKSRPMKQITHPLERSITGFFVITLFFTMLAIISGAPIVGLLYLLVPIAFVIRNLISCDFLISNNNEHKCTPAERYWLNSNWKNNCKKGQAVCLFMIDQDFTLEKCRDLIQSRLIQKVGTERFRWILRYRGIFRFPYFDRIPVSEFDVNQHISALKPIKNVRKLKQYIMKLMHVPFDLTSQPGWYIHYVKVNGKLQNQVALIVRVHQALFDGINLSKILIGLLSDQAPIMYSLAEQQRYRLEYEKLKSSTTTRFQSFSDTGINNPFFNNLACALMKPRFGGFNYSVNICRAVIVGPLTFFLWLIWAITRRNANFLLSTKFFINIRKFVKTIDLNSLIEEEDNLNEKKKSNFLSVQNQQWKSKRKDHKRDQFSKQKSINSLDQSSCGTHSKFTPSTTFTTTTTSGSKYRLKRPEKAICWLTTSFSSVQRIKQVTRSSLNDVVLSCVAGAVREYLVDINNITNPPNLGITLPVDISVASDHDMENIGVNYVFLTAPLPTSIESK